MKQLFLTFIMALIAFPAMAAETEQKLDPIEAKYVCMVNDSAFDKEQIAVEVEGKTYYGCCTMCEARLKKDTDIRSAVDPVSGVEVDKSEAVIGADDQGNVYYFENTANLEKFVVDPDSKSSGMMHDGMSKGDTKNMHKGMMKDHKDMMGMHENMMSTSDDLIKGTGILNAVKAETDKVNITHGPIPALQWPEMTMDILVSESVDLSIFEEGQDVRFFLKLENKTYIIEKMEAIDAQPPEDSHDHQH